MVSTLCHSRQQAEEHMDLQVIDRPLDLPSLSGVADAPIVREGWLAYLARARRHQWIQR
ncbi:hypothetical protein ACP70R_041031 [Stipagrostis hirtigluma subsp. patula]